MAATLLNSPRATELSVYVVRTFVELRGMLSSNRELAGKVRYRTRDITRISTAPCDCGRTHLCILRIAGRSDDMLIIRGVNVYPSQIEAAVVGRPMLAPHYLLVVQRLGNLDTVTIEVEAQAGVAEEAFGTIARDAVHHVKSLVGITTRVVVKQPGEIPRSQGKAVRVRDLRHMG